MATATQKGAISLTQIDMRSVNPGTPLTRRAVVLPVARIDEVQEAIISDYHVNQYQPIAVKVSLVIKVNGERFYVAEDTNLIRNLINSVA